MALPTLDATFASSADLPRKQMLAKWLVEELGETQASSSVSVLGAGSIGADGLYIDSGVFGGKRFYNLESGGYVIAWDSPNWVIRTITSITIYTSNNNVEFPWQVTTWSVASGSAPVPTVSESPAVSPIAKYYDLPERYLWAKIAVAAGAPRSEADYISLPTRYVWKAIYDAVSGSSLGTIDWSENLALGHIAAAYRGDTGNPANLATYIDWPWRYKVASIIDGIVDNDVEAFIALSGATDRDGLNAFVKGVKNLGLWDSMVAWPLRSTQNAGTGTTAYSLGGLGAFNGTLVSGPTWGANGIDFDGSNDRITLPNGSFGTGNAATSVWAFLKNETNSARMIVLSQGNNNASTDAYALESPSVLVTNDAAGVAFSGSNIAAKSTAWKSLLIGNTSSGFGGKDGGSVTEFSLNNVLNKSGTGCAIGAFGDPAGVAPFDGLIAAVIRINATPTTALNGQIYNLYKTTLGNGLGLP